MNVTEQMVEAADAARGEYWRSRNGSGSAKEAMRLALEAATALSQAEGTQEPSIWWKTDVNGRMNNATDDPFCASVWREQGYILKEGFTRPREQEGADAPSTIEALWRKCGLPEYFLGNGGSNYKLYDFASALRAEDDVAFQRISLALGGTDEWTNRETMIAYVVARAEVPPCERTETIAWAAECWKAEVANRPLQNIHRSALDVTWRQVIRHFGGDPEALCGPDHRDLVDAAGASYAHPLPAASFQAGAEGWNYDMDAAPRDGSEVILATKGFVGGGFWNDGAECRMAEAGFFWEESRDRLLTARNCKPFAWMSHPDEPPPPASSEGR